MADMENIQVEFDETDGTVTVSPKLESGWLSFVFHPDCNRLTIVGQKPGVIKTQVTFDALLSALDKESGE